MALEALARAAAPGCDARLDQCVGGPVLVVAPHAIVEVMRFLRDDPAQRFDMLVDLTAVDRIASRGRIEVVYQLCSTSRKARLTVKTEVESASPSVPTVTSLWKSADWAEREVWDMFGVRFEGHPNLRRILMYEEFDGHPLRKDYPFDKRQSLVEERDPINDPWPSRDGR